MPGNLNEMNQTLVMFSFVYIVCCDKLSLYQGMQANVKHKFCSGLGFEKSLQKTSGSVPQFSTSHLLKDLSEPQNMSKQHL